MAVKLRTEHHLEFLSFKGGFTGTSESTLVKIPHCRKLHVTVHLLMSMAGSKPEDNVKPLHSQFLQAYHQLLHAKERELGYR